VEESVAVLGWAVADCERHGGWLVNCSRVSFGYSYCLQSG
jgi:hypothetical protein